MGKSVKDLDGIEFLAGGYRLRSIGPRVRRTARVVYTQVKRERDRELARERGMNVSRTLDVDEFHTMLYTRIRHERTCRVARRPSIDVSRQCLLDGQRSLLIRILPSICSRHRRCVTRVHGNSRAKDRLKRNTCVRFCEGEGICKERRQIG